MSLTLSAETELRIQQQLERGQYADAGELIEHALDLMDGQENWSEEEKAELDDGLAASTARFEQGEGIPREQVHALLTERRAHARRG